MTTKSLTSSVNLCKAVSIITWRFLVCRLLFLKQIEF